MFIGREREFERLRGLLSKNIASLVVCKGRRRIGKSTLLEKFGNEIPRFLRFQGLAPRDGVSNQSQLENFAQQLSAQTSIPRLILEDWTQAFSFLASQTENGRIAILIDEISWFASNDADFAGKLKIAWDTQFKNNSQLILILCGSVSSWIDKNILNNTGFVGRISLTIDLMELSLSECSQFWGSNAQFISSFEKFKILAVTGGVPRYLEEIQHHLTAEDNIKQLCFEPEGMLYSEFEKIFDDIFSSRASLYKKLCESLVNSQQSFSNICNAIDREESGVVLEYLEDLVQGGFLNRDYVYHSDGKRSRLSRFRLKDNYLRFYLKYIRPRKDKIKQGLFSFNSFGDLINWQVVFGLQFENLILNNLSSVINRLKIDPNAIISASPYFQNFTTKTKGACQIDLLINTRHDSMYLCEIKYRKKIDVKVIKEVQRKIEVLKRAKYVSIRPVLIYEGELDDDVTETKFFHYIIPFAEFLKFQ